MTRTAAEKRQNENQAVAPHSTAVRTALWPSLHREVDSPPHVFEDEVQGSPAGIGRIDDVRRSC